MKIEEEIIAILHSMMVGNKEKSLKGKGLVARISEKTGIDSLEVKMTLGRLARQGLLRGMTAQGDYLGNVSLTIEAPQLVEPVSLIRWREALCASGLVDREAEALIPCHDRFEGFSDNDLQNLVKSLAALKSAQEVEKNTPRFIVSAKYLLGSSKLLGSLPAPALKAFGINIEYFPDAIPQMVLAGPENPEAVLLIENPHSFEEAIAAGCAERIALIVTYGYGLSRSGEAYGNSLAGAIELTDKLVPLVRKGNPPSPKSLLSHPKILFWGDLDREGIRIYASLRKRLPTLRISALYRPMLEAMEQGRSHPYAKITAKEKQGTPDWIPDDAASLIRLCKERGVDQEVVDREVILRFASVSLEEIA